VPQRDNLTGPLSALIVVRPSVLSTLQQKTPFCPFHITTITASGLTLNPGPLVTYTRIVPGSRLGPDLPSHHSLPHRAPRERVGCAAGGQGREPRRVNSTEPLSALIVVRSSVLSRLQQKTPFCPFHITTITSSGLTLNPRPLVTYTRIVPGSRLGPDLPSQHPLPHQAPRERVGYIDIYIYIYINIYIHISG